MAHTTSANDTLGNLLRTWRTRRRLSQLQLAADAEISQRHLSFMESGRSLPSRDMVLKLAECLAIPLRERNQLLMRAGLAPIYSESNLNDPSIEQARQVIERILKGHEPYPALAVDRHWNLLAANRSMFALTQAADPQLLQAPINVLRLSLHPKGLASQIVNFREWRSHILGRLNQLIENSADNALIDLRDELQSYPIPAGARAYTEHQRHRFAGIAIPLILKTPKGELSFISTTTVFGTPLDISLAELAIEAFFRRMTRLQRRCGRKISQAKESFLAAVGEILRDP